MEECRGQVQRTLWLGMRRRRRMKPYYKIALQLQPCGDRSLFEIALWRCTIDQCKLIANESYTCSLWVSLSHKFKFLSSSVIVANEGKSEEVLSWSDVMDGWIRPSLELEDIALSRWEWTTLWQPFSKWQNPSIRIDQLFFCLSAVIFRPSLPLFILSSHHHNPLPAAPYWSSLVIGWAVIWDGHWWMSANCFSFSLLHSSRGWWSHNPRHRARQGQIAMECWPE